MTWSPEERAATPPELKRPGRQCPQTAAARGLERIWAWRPLSRRCADNTS
jgi:hypothetical protein